MNVTFDIETIPAQSAELIALLKAEAEAEKAEIKAPSNYKDEAKISEFIAAKCAEIDASADQKYRSTSFDGAMGEICVIGYAIDDEAPVSFFGDERRVVAEFYDTLRSHYSPSSDRRPVFIGHNLIDFDLRFLFQRSVILGIKPPIFVPFHAKPWDGSVFDTMTAWAGFGKRIKLDKLCKVFGIAGKGSEIGEEIDGSKVWDFVKAGRIAEVAKYCEGDVMRTRAVHKRLTFAERFEQPDIRQAA